MMHMKKFVIALMFSLVCSVSLNAQYFDDGKEKEEEQEPTNIDNRVFFGGNFGLSFSFGRGGSQYFELSPLVGYRVSENFSAGAAFTYLYISREYIFLPSYNRITLKNNTYGPRAFLRYSFLDDYFLQTEYESLNTEVPLNDGTTNTGRAWVPGFFVGGGSTFQVSQNLAVNAMILYNLSYNDLRSPYVSPLVVRGGIILR